MVKESIRALCIYHMLPDHTTKNEVLAHKECACKYACTVHDMM